MLRPTTLLRPLVAPLRLSGSQSAPTAILARRCFATTPSSRSEPPSTESSSATTTLAAFTEPTSTQPPITELTQQPPKDRARAFFKLRLLNKERAQQAQQEQPVEQAADLAPQEAVQQPPAEQPPTQQQLAQLPYRVLRTPSNQLAVYQLAKRGGNKKLTNIKKVEGDRASFRAALAQILGVEEKGVVVNNLTGHVIVPGHRRTEVMGWLEKQGF